MRTPAAVEHRSARGGSTSALFLCSNTNKRDLTLDLARPEDGELALRLIERVRLVLENFTPRVLEQLRPRLGRRSTRLNPRCLLVRMPAFGLSGPWRDHAGFAQTMEQVTGLAWITGHVDDQPRIQRGPCDPNGGMHAVVGALVGARDARRAPASGSLLEVDDGRGRARTSPPSWCSSGPRTATRSSATATAARGVAPQGLYATDTPERWLVISVATDEQWAALVDALGRPDWATDPDAARRTPAGAPRTTCSTSSSPSGRPTPISTRRSSCCRARGAGRAGVDPRLTSSTRSCSRPRATTRSSTTRSSACAATPTRAVPLRQRRPLAAHARHRRSASTTTRSSPTSASPTRRSPSSRPMT